MEKVTRTTPHRRDRNLRTAVRGLLASMATHAYRDAQRGDQNAATWLTTPGAREIFLSLGIPSEKITVMLGNLRIDNPQEYRKKRNIMATQNNPQETANNFDISTGIE